MAGDDFNLSREEVVLLIIDIQERLAPAMKEKDGVIKNCQHLIELAKLCGFPVVVTEQYPKGLGRTVPELQAALADTKPIEKTSFSCCGEPAFLPELSRLNRKKIIVTGMEAHVCVLQTVLGLLKEGFVPHLVQDAVCSRNEENAKTGVAFMRDAGAVVTCTETVLFQVLKTAGTEEFKKIAQRIK
jgi:nicotinamidase-related amidase